MSSCKIYNDWLLGKGHLDKTTIYTENKNETCIDWFSVDSPSPGRGLYVSVPSGEKKKERKKVSKNVKFGLQEGIQEKLTLRTSSWLCGWSLFLYLAFIIQGI